MILTDRIEEEAQKLRGYAHIEGFKAAFNSELFKDLLAGAYRQGAIDFATEDFSGTRLENYYNQYLNQLTNDTTTSNNES